jgi:hypothetical protein
VPERAAEFALRAHDDITEARKRGRAMSVLTRYFLDAYSCPNE